MDNGLVHAFPKDCMVCSSAVSDHATALIATCRIMPQRLASVTTSRECTALSNAPAATSALHACSPVSSPDGVASALPQWFASSIETYVHLISG